MSTTYQQSVYTSQAIGIPGAAASTNPIVSTPIGYVAEVEIPIGGFVWGGTKSNLVKNSTVGNNAPIGFVMREITNPIFKVSEASQNFVPIGFNASVIVKGDFFASTLTAATVGQKVFASTTDGSIKTDTAGATVSGFIETDFVVKTAGDADETIIISSY